MWFRDPRRQETWGIERGGAGQTCDAVPSYYTILPLSSATCDRGRDTEYRDYYSIVTTTVSWLLQYRDYHSIVTTTVVTEWNDKHYREAWLPQRSSIHSGGWLWLMDSLFTYTC